MIVMSTAARALLNKMKSYCSNLCYEVTDVELYAHTYKLDTLESWWKGRISDGEAIYNSHEWFLPKFGSEAWPKFYAYVNKKTPKKVMFELIWDDNLEQMYHYLCGNVLLCDFGIEEFRRITVIAIYPLRDVQDAVNAAKNSCRDVITTPYILSILERKEQAKEIESERTQKKIIESQRGVININTRRVTPLEATLMKAQLMEIRKERDMDRLLAQVLSEMLKEKFKHAIT